MPRKYKPVTCNKTDFMKLLQLSKDQSKPRLSKRAQMVLQCIQGKQIKDIAIEFGERPNTVILWRDRFSKEGPDGLFNLPRGKHANVYGSDFKNRLLLALDSSPPDGYERWTGGLLAVKLGVPPDVVWRYLRKEKINLREISPAGNPGTGNPETPKEDYTVTLHFQLRKDKLMNQNTNPPSPNSSPEEKMDLEIIARIKGKDGTVIEKKVCLDQVLPSVFDFDLSTKEGFLRDFDTLEKAVLTARNQVAADLTEGYMEAASKKKGQRREKGTAVLCRSRTGQASL